VWKWLELCSFELSILDWHTTPPCFQVFDRFMRDNVRVAFLHSINELVQFALNVPLELFYASTRVINNRFYE